MNVAVPEALKPRKTPRQARSEATVDAIFQSTIQVLLSDGLQGLTTTRVAERAGVSVGTMYQYFPHKQALLFAVLQQQLGSVADAVDAACAALRGEPLAVMAESFVEAFVDAKTVNPEGSRALYRVAAELDTADLVAGYSERLRNAVIGLLTSAPDAAFEDAATVASTLLAALGGVVRSAFEHEATPQTWRGLRAQLALMSRAYLREAAILPT